MLSFFVKKIKLGTETLFWRKKNRFIPYIKNLFYTYEKPILTPAKKVEIGYNYMDEVIYAKRVTICFK